MAIFWLLSSTRSSTIKLILFFSTIFAHGVLPKKALANKESNVLLPFFFFFFNFSFSVSFLTNAWNVTNQSVEKVQLHSMTAIQFSLFFFPRTHCFFFFLKIPRSAFGGQFPFSQGHDCWARTIYSCALNLSTCFQMLLALSFSWAERSFFFFFK